MAAALAAIRGAPKPAPAPALRESRVLDRLPVARLDRTAAAIAIADRRPDAPFAYVVTINAQLLLLAERPETGLGPALERAWLRLNDSRVLSRLHRAVRGEDLPVAAGSDVCLLLLTSFLQKTDPVTIIGGGPMLAGALRARFGLQRIAQHDPPMGYMDQPEAWETAIRFIEEHPARILFVATGAPRSERLMQAVAERGRATGTGIAVGSGLLFAAGLTARAPAWMRRSGLEWLHRAATEPRRLGSRYAADLPGLLRLTWGAWRSTPPASSPSRG
ncbi:WecB/TagA/CpsF family glycosyltransferase [Muricoccus radiodurans]|uniref:WecB/TagA/CpsF family glycosyltransferase n=1 Tax=Muricoccus radiodurans TaxID=2231721 RepID=UPI003CF060DA